MAQETQQTQQPIPDAIKALAQAHGFDTIYNISTKNRVDVQSGAIVPHVTSSAKLEDVDTVMGNDSPGSIRRQAGQEASPQSPQQV